LNLLILISVFVFQVGMDLSFTDALYFIVATVTTTGYGDITPTRSSDFLKLYAAALMILGSATLATLYSLITDLIVTARFRELLGRRRVPPAGHVVVAGLGNLGYRVVGQLLAAGVPVVVIERNAGGELVGAVDSSVEVIFGDARSPDVLERAAISQARALAAVTGDDAANLGISLAAREMNAGLRTVSRLFDADLARQTQAALCIDAVLSASAIAVPTFAASALYPNVLHAVVVGDRMLVLYRQVVSAEWSGLTPQELADHQGVVVMSWSASNQAPLTSPPTVPLNSGEIIVVAESLPLAP
jgi:Trk K+ transport system NAD-binding subunit